MANEPPSSTDGAPVTAEILGRTRVFERIDRARLDRLAAIARLECVPAGETIVREGREADDLRVVIDGRVTISIDLPGKLAEPVSTVSAGEILGWSALLPQKTWQATATAQKNTTMVVFSGSELVQLCEADHELGYHVMLGVFETVAHRLHDSWLQRLDMFS